MQHILVHKISPRGHKIPNLLFTPIYIHVVFLKSTCAAVSPFRRCFCFPFFIAFLVAWHVFLLYFGILFVLWNVFFSSVYRGGLMSAGPRLARLSPSSSGRVNEGWTPLGRARSGTGSGVLRPKSQYMYTGATPVSGSRNGSTNVINIGGLAVHQEQRLSRNLAKWTLPTVEISA